MKLAETRPISENTKLLVFAGLAVVLLGMGFILSPSPADLLAGYSKIVTHPSLIDFDGLKQAGHFGTAFFNSGLLLLVVMLSYKVTKTEIQGVQIAAAMMVLGFSFYGKNILNIWFPIIGVLLQTIVSKKPLSSSTALAWFSTALSPMFSVLAFGTELLGPGSFLAIGVGACFTIFAGFLVGIIAGYLPSIHKGFVLFNAGYAAGLVGILINSLIKALGLGHDRYPYVEVATALKEGIEADYVSGSNVLLGTCLVILFAYLILAGLLLKGGSNFRKLAGSLSFGGNYVSEYGFASTLMNMGLLGLVTTGYVFLTVKGQLCGPVYACIWTAVGFAAAGVTLRSHLPIMAGVFLTALLTGGITGVLAGTPFLEAALTKAGSRGMLLAAIFSCGLSPVVGKFGILSGLLVGGVHSVLVPNLGILHGWMSLYNNGLSQGLISTLFYPYYARKEKQTKD